MISFLLPPLSDLAAVQITCRYVCVRFFFLRATAGLADWACVFLESNGHAALTIQWTLRRSCVFGSWGHTKFVWWIQAQTSSCPLGSYLLCQGNVLPLGNQLKAFGEKGCTGVGWGQQPSAWTTGQTKWIAKGSWYEETGWGHREARLQSESSSCL